MKKIVALLTAVLAVTAFAQDKGKGEPVAVKTTPNPVVAPAPEVKKEVPKQVPTKSPSKDQKKTAEPAKPAASK